jgi:hypothetical protein
MQVFSDINGSAKVVPLSLHSPLTLAAVWISGDDNDFMPLYCNSTSNSNLIYHTIRVWEPDLGSEVGNDSETGTLYFAAKAVSDDDSSISLLIADGWYRRPIPRTWLPNGITPSYGFTLREL